MLKFTRALVGLAVLSPVLVVLSPVMGVIAGIADGPVTHGLTLMLLANAAFGTPLWALLSVPFCLRYWRRGLWWVAASIPLWLGAVALIVTTTV